ncbi:MAG: response regulator, partial [Bacteroidota bacterium]
MKKKILVIEDDAVLKDNTAELLKLSGYDVITAADGRQGMALINNDRPDLVLCDIFMNGSGGYSVLQAKNQNTETAGIPLIFMTGKTDQAELRKGMELGADDFLFKPFQDIELLRAIETRINMREHLISKYLQDGTGKIVPLPELIQDILQEAVSIELKRGELLYRQDGASVAVYYIIKGSIKVYRISDQGKSYITDLASEGDIVGYKAAIENREYRQFAESMTPALVKRIPG